MPYLAIDTTSATVTVAVGNPGGAGQIKRRIAQRTTSEQLLGAIRECLDEYRIEIDRLDGLVATAGPGSFTGTRIGLATMLGFHQATGLRATAVSTLSALATSCPAHSGDVVLSVVDALRGHWYAERYRRVDGELPVSLSPPRYLSGGEVLGLDFDALVGHGFDSSEAFEPNSLAGALLDMTDLAGFEWTPALLSRPIYLRKPNITRSPTASSQKSAAADSRGRGVE